MEREFIKWLRERIPSELNRGMLLPHVETGMGDDAAVLRYSAAGRLVVTTDMLTDGVDFRLHECDPYLVGRKALAVNLSDLAAMAAEPLAAFISIAIPRSGGVGLAEQLYEGLIPLADDFGIAIAGGDTNTWDGPLVINVTAIGKAHTKGPLLRSGALPGDEILVTGEFGGSILGRHFQFVPRVREAILLHSNYVLHAGMDVSDGLSLDLSRMAESSGCGAVIDLDAIPVSPDTRKLAPPPAGAARSFVDHALSDGEDFELLLAVPPAEADRLLVANPLSIKLTRIGHFISEPGLWRPTLTGEREPLEPRGYQH